MGRSEDLISRDLMSHILNEGAAVKTRCLQFVLISQFTSLSVDGAGHLLPMGVGVERPSGCGLLVVSVLSCIDSEWRLGPLWLVSALMVWAVMNRAWREATTVRTRTRESDISRQRSRVLSNGLFPHCKPTEISLPEIVYNSMAASLFNPQKPVSCNRQLCLSTPLTAQLQSMGSRNLGRSLQDGASAAVKILIVEDIEINRILLRKLFKDLNLPFEEAENGQVAVDYFKQGKSFDLVLMDKEMPVMDGHEATRQLRSLGVKTPIIALTGNSLQSDKDMFFQAGADEFKTKPLSRDELIKLLAAYGLNRPTTKPRILPRNQP